MLQSSGLGNSLNAITSLLVPYQIPMLDPDQHARRRRRVERRAGADGPRGPAHLDAIGSPARDRRNGRDDGRRPCGWWRRPRSARALRGACLLPRRITVPRAARRRRMNAPRSDARARARARTADDADRREPRPSGVRPLRGRRSARPISTRGAAWGSRRRSASASRWRVPTCASFVARRRRIAADESRIAGDGRLDPDPKTNRPPSEPVLPTPSE